MKKAISYKSRRKEIESTLIHDEDNAHKKLVKELQLNSIAYDSNSIKQLKDKNIC